MEQKLPKKVEKSVRLAVYREADAFGYATSSRGESGQFMNRLVKAADIGGVLKEYLPKANVRTYIKDAILNAYMKRQKKAAMDSLSPEQVIKEVFNVSAEIVVTLTGKDAGGFCLRATDRDNYYVVSSGNVLKWGTALRKALEYIARTPTLKDSDPLPQIALRLADVSKSLTESERRHIAESLGLLGIGVRFC